MSRTCKAHPLQPDDTVRGPVAATTGPRTETSIRYCQDRARHALRRPLSVFGRGTSGPVHHATRRTPAVLARTRPAPRLPAPPVQREVRASLGVEFACRTTELRINPNHPIEHVLVSSGLNKLWRAGSTVGSEAGAGLPRRSLVRSAHRTSAKARSRTQGTAPRTTSTGNPRRRTFRPGPAVVPT
jgi:hypothetical protein